MDLLSECNGTAAPLDVFTRECCANCINPDCSRSLSGKLKFDQRVSTWHERLFSHVPRMDTHDPRYPKIAGQKFLMLDVNRTPEISTSAWMDPRDVEKAAEKQAPPTVVEPPRVALPVAAEEAAPAAQPPPATAPAQPAGPKTLPKHLLLANTPVQSGKMIKAPPAAPASATPAKDPWAGPTPAPKSDIPVVQPGARVKMGGGGV